MLLNLADSQVVSEVQSVLFSFIQQGPTTALVILKNSGVNTMNYRFLEFNGTAWVDLDTAGTDLNNTLSANEVKQVIVSSTYPQVQLVGNASGGAFLEFGISRYVNRPSGGPVPILSL